MTNIKLLVLGVVAAAALTVGTMFGYNMLKGTDSNNAKYVPSTSCAVFAVNMGDLITKVDLKSLRELEIIQGLQKQIKSQGIPDLLQDPELSGLDISSQSFVFLEMDSESKRMSYGGVITSIKNAKKFVTLLKKAGGKDEFKIQKSKDNKLIFSQIEENFIMGAYKKTVIFLWADRSRHTKGLKKHLAEIFNNANKGNSLINNNNFSLLLKKSWDLSAWVDINKMLSVMGEVKLEQMLKSMKNDLVTLEDNYAQMTLSFNNGSVDLDTRYFVRDKQFDMYYGMINNEIGANVMKYIPGKNLLAVYGAAMNIDGILKFAKSIDERTADGIAKSMEGGPLTIDEIKNTFAGDILMAITELDYDKIKNYQPRPGAPAPGNVVLCMSLNDSAGADKLLGFYEKQRMLQKKDGHYVLPVPGFTVYVAKNNEILVATVSKKLADAVSAGGLSSEDMIKSDVSSYIAGKNFAFYLNLQNIANAVPRGLIPDRNIRKLADLVGDKVESLAITSELGGNNDVGSTISLILADKTENSLKQIIHTGIETGSKY